MRDVSRMNQSFWSRGVGSIALVFVTALGCGGTSVGGGGHAGPMGGGSGSGQGGNPPMTPGIPDCPAQVPADGSACTAISRTCQYGDDSNLCALQPEAYCLQGHWQISMRPRVTDCGWMLPPTICPATPPQAGTACYGSVSCNYPNTFSSCPPYSTSTCINGTWSSGGPLIECYPPGVAGQGGGAGEGPGGGGEGPGSAGQAPAEQGGAFSAP